MSTVRNEISGVIYLREALALARRGIGLASPNPCVGAIVVDRYGEVAGRGWHRYAERDHAEVIALREAGSRAEGATLYINLEPCSHHGRTPPCADTLIAAKIARVVAAMSDPNPLVSGMGFAKLRAAGVKVEIAGEAQGGNFLLVRREAMRLNEAFAKYIRTGQPFVTLKAGMTLDGKIASRRSARETITGAESLAHVQDLRHASDAILVGIGTVLADNPLLTDRSGKPRCRSLLRVIVDSTLKLPIDSELVRTANQDLIVFCSSADDGKRKYLESKGVTVVQLGVTKTSGKESDSDLAKIFELLGGMQITSVLLEGGARLNGAVLAAGLADKVFLFVAPKIMGGSESVSLAEGTATDSLCLQDIRLHRFGEDFAVEGYLRDVYA